ncbi:MAG: S8 family serine peptidase, partial [Cytophagales bacterium]|nr:S8 family serine peptidase [Cytophagales bacterium]
MHLLLEFKNQEKLRVNVLMEFDGNANELEKLGVNLRTKVGNIYTADLPIEKLEQIREVEGMKLIETARLAEMELDESRQMVKIDQAHSSYPYRGEGVIIGFIDTGIDIDHPTFQDSNGNTRILSIWDQNKTGTPPSGYNYGTIWSATQINNGSCTHVDQLGHGTHVAGIAAGNGNSTTGQTDFIGMAPEADIIMVASKTSFSDYFVEYSTQIDYVIDAVNYIATKAKSLGKPWVINISFGMRGGPRNGSSLYERAISEFINDNNFGKGRLIIKSAGNSRYSSTVNNEEDKIHAGGNSTSSKQFRLRDDQGTVGNSATIEIYYPTSDNYSITITSPNGIVYGPVTKNDTFFTENTNDGWVSINNFFLEEDIYYEGSDATGLIFLNDYDPEDDGIIENHLVNGTWTLAVSGGSGEWDAYLISSNRNLTDVFFENSSYSNENLITEPGNAPNVITVGSVNSKNTWIYPGGTETRSNFPVNNVSYFSSPGPTRSGLSKPEIYAPGAWVASALSSDQSAINTTSLSYNVEYYHRAGTSMAAPHVSGVVALLLEKWCVDLQQDYGYPEIKHIFNETKTANNILDAQGALAYSDPITGIEDGVKIINYSGRSPREISTNESNRYYAYFYDADPTGDYATSYDWKMEFYHAGGTYLASQYSTGQGSTSNWYVTINESSLPDNSWIRDADGNVKGLVTVSCMDNDGYSHSDEWEIGLRLKPNKPIIFSSSVGTSSVTLSYASGGSSTYKAYYGTSTGSYANSQSAGSSTSTTISGLDLTNGSTYYFAVTGINSYGESEYSQELKIEPEN